MTGRCHGTGPASGPAAALACALAWACLAAPAHAQAHTIRGIAEAAAGEGRFDPFPSINQSGTVAYLRESPGGAKGVYTSHNGVETRLADTTGPLSDFSGVCIDESGRVSFHATRDDGGSAIHAVMGGTLETIAVTGGTYLALDAGPAANAGGAIAFRATLADGTRALLLHERGTTTTLVDSRGGFRDFSGTPALNERGEVAFAATFDSGGSGVFKIWRGTLTTLAVTTPLRIAWTDPSINAAGVVVATVFRDDGVVELVRFDQGAEEILVSTGGHFLSLGRPLVNAAGRIAFAAYREGSGTGLYAGPRPGPDTILQHGTKLFGSRLASVQLSATSLNGPGHLAFSYDLANGASGIAVIAPASRRPSLSMAGSRTVAARRSILTLRGSAQAEGGLAAVEVSYREPGRGKSRMTRKPAAVSGESWTFRFRPTASRTTLTIQAIDQEGQSSAPLEVRILRR